VKYTLSIALFASVAFLASPAPGFDLEGYSWNRNRTVLMHLSLPPGPPEGYTDGSPSLNASAEAALNLWNQHLNHMKFAVKPGSILPPDGTDANTSVSMSNTIYGETFGDRTLAVTLLTPRGSTFVEADVIFNDAFAYDSYRGPLVESPEDFQRIALHEFGHVLGLDHPDQAGQSLPAIMNSTISNLDSLQADDIEGAHSIYDSGPPFLSSNPAPNLVNLSTRAFVGTGERVLIGGFIIQGSETARVILRAIGNSLPALGIQNPLRDPEMELRGSGGALLAHSDDWIDSADASTIASYRLDPTNSRESAIVATLVPGDYTFLVKAFDNGDGDLSGTAVVELYVVQSGSSRAANISTRGQVLQGDQVVIGGFIVGGNQPKTVIMRALGPSLGQSQIANPLNDPTLELRNAAGNLLAFNDNWGNDPNAAQIQAEGLAPSQAAESALRVTLAPGSYTGIVRSASGATGIGLVEIYDRSPPP
jgi:Matrixin